MFEQIMPMNRTRSMSSSGSFVRITTKMIYFSSDGNFGLLGKYIKIYYDRDNFALLFSPCKAKEKGSFKVSPCKEACRAGRIETWNTVKALHLAGFPLDALDVPLKTIQLPDESIIAYVKESVA